MHDAVFLAVHLRNRFWGNANKPNNQRYFSAVLYHTHSTLSGHIIQKLEIRADRRRKTNQRNILELKNDQRRHISDRHYAPANPSGQPLDMSSFLYP